MHEQASGASRVDGHEIILHQYDVSPYSARVRLVLGIKGIAWRACVPPVIAPKPHLIALTGGYRRVPVMQIGADIYCDSELIIRVLDRLFPDPPLHAEGSGAMAFALAPWFTSLLIDTAVPLVFRHAQAIDPAFARDREIVMERPFVNLPAWRAAAPHALESLRAQLGWLENQLADGRPWLSGNMPGLIDVFVYPIIDFMRSKAAEMTLLERLPTVIAWERRMLAIGNGRRTGIDALDAIEVARNAKPATGGRVADGEPNGLRVGERVVIRAADYARDPIAGELFSASSQHVTVRRVDALTGEVAVHFPRYGFRIERAEDESAGDGLVREQR